MLRHQLHTRYASLRVSIVVLWMLSLVTVGISPLYYVSTSSSTSSETADASSSRHDSEAERESGLSPENHAKKQPNITRGAVALRFTHNPFVVESLSPRVNSADSDSLVCNPLENDGGMTHKAPSGSPVVLWLVDAGVSGTVGLSKLIRIPRQTAVADIQTGRPATGAITGASIYAEHPTKRFAATLLGQKPSGVS